MDDLIEHLLAFALFLLLDLQSFVIYLLAPWDGGLAVLSFRGLGIGGVGPPKVVYFLPVDDLDEPQIARLLLGLGLHRFNILNDTNYN